MVIDVTVPSAPATIIQWDAVRDGGLPSGGGNNILHSVSASDDGRTLYWTARSALYRMKLNVAGAPQ